MHVARPELRRSMALLERWSPGGKFLFSSTVYQIPHRACFLPTTLCFLSQFPILPLILPSLPQSSSPFPQFLVPSQDCPFYPIILWSLMLFPLSPNPWFFSHKSPFLLIILFSPRIPHVSNNSSCLLQIPELPHNSPFFPPIPHFSQNSFLSFSSPFYSHNYVFTCIFVLPAYDFSEV